MSEVSAVEPPASTSRTVPVPAVKVKDCAPLIVFKNEIFAPPPAEVSHVTGPSRVTAPSIEIAPLLVVV